MVYIKICPECDSSMYWNEDDEEWSCSNCGMTIKTDEDDYDEEEDEDMPLGCQTCGGSDNYPKCWYSCKMNPDN